MSVRKHMLLFSTNLHQTVISKNRFYLKQEEVFNPKDKLINTLPIFGACYICAVYLMLT